DVRPLAQRVVVARVVVRVSGQHQDDRGAALDYLRLHEREVPKALGFPERRLHPARLCSAEDHAVTRDQLLGGLVEVCELGTIDVCLELNIDAPNPDAMRQLEHEVAPLLTCSPPAD